MKVLQFRGPFTRGQTLTVDAQVDYIHTHIGFQIPKRQPINKVGSYSLPYSSPLHPVDVQVNGEPYRITNGILEFDNLAEISWDIEFLQDLPAETVIDIVYTDTDMS